MDSNTIVIQLNKQLTEAVNVFNDDLKKLRSGRANASLLDGIMVEAYGAKMPLIQVGSISTPEPQLLQVNPFDPNNIEAIASAIRENQSLGLNPTDDGRVIRLPIPPLTTERRQQIVKILHDKLENAMIRMRNARHEALKEAEQAKKDKNISGDDYSHLQKQVDETMAKQKTELDNLAKTKEQEIMTL
jgi:ribosome recycling factor